MSLETELKKNTAAMIALNETMLATAPAKSAPEPTVSPTTAPQASVTAGPVPNVLTPPVAMPPTGAPSIPAATALTPPPLAVATPPVAPASPPPVATIPPATMAPADDEARQKLVQWAQGELGKIQGILGPQRMFEMIQAEGVEKLSLIGSDRLPRFVVDAQNEAANISAQTPGVPQ